MELRNTTISVTERKDTTVVRIEPDRLKMGNRTLIDL